MFEDDPGRLVLILLAFGVVILLILALSWVLKKVSTVSARIGRAGEDPRLSIREAIQVDHKRRLVLVRRDHVEHLVLIGGENDLLVEHHIMPQQPGHPQQPGQPRPNLPVRPQTTQQPATPAQAVQPGTRPATPGQSPGISAPSSQTPARPATKPSETEEKLSPKKSTIGMATTATASLFSKKTVEGENSKPAQTTQPTPQATRPTSDDPADPQRSESKPEEAKEPIGVLPENTVSAPKAAQDKTEEKALKQPPGMANNTGPEPSAPAVEVKSSNQEPTAQSAPPVRAAQPQDSHTNAEPEQPHSETDAKQDENGDPEPEKRSYDDEINRLLSELSGDSKR